MKKRVLALLVVATISLGGLASADQTDQVSANKKLVRAMVEAINQHRFDDLDHIIATDIKRHCAATPDVHIKTREQFKSFLLKDLESCPDASQEINLILAEDDLVAVHATYSGTQSGSMGPYPASGKKIKAPFIAILRIEQGRIAEMWVEWDNLSMLVELGHVPAAGDS